MTQVHLIHFRTTEINKMGEIDVPASVPANSKKKKNRPWISLRNMLYKTLNCFIQLKATKLKKFDLLYGIVIELLEAFGEIMH